MKNSITIIDNRDGKKYEYNILKGTRGPDVVDIRNFFKDSGMFTYDPGFTSTASCSSKITFINGAKGELRYRSYPIEELATKYSYLEVCYLLLKSKLPSKEELKEFDKELRDNYFLDKALFNLLNSFPEHSHPMATLSAAITALATFFKEYVDDKDYFIMAKRLIAKVPTIAALSYRNSIGLIPIQPKREYSFTKNFLYMMRAYPDGSIDEIKDIEVKVLDTIFTLHADHEQNASTTVVRSVASTGAHPYVAISSGVAALWGRAHGGANESVIAQLRLIDSVENVPKYIAKAKDPNDSFRLMGFGHRVYKNFDPRAKILKELQEQLREELNLNSKLLEVAREIEEIALNDEYFIKRNLYPNIDFYTGILLTALKIPKEMFTPIFVIGRSVGWITQLIEFKEDKESKITRPRQLYIGD